MEHRRHPNRLSALAVLAQVVHEHALLGRQAHTLGAQPEDLGLWLVDDLVARDHDAVEELREGRAVVVADAHRVRDQPRTHHLGAGAPDRVEHGLLRAHVPEHPLEQSRPAFDPEELSEALAELVVAQDAGLEAAYEAQRLGVSAKQPLDRIRVESLVDAECSKGLEHVGGEDAAEVDQQALHLVWASSSAFSASAGTPSSKWARYGSSVKPAV